MWLSEAIGANPSKQSQAELIRTNQDQAELIGANRINSDKH